MPTCDEVEAILLDSKNVLQDLDRFCSVQLSNWRDSEFRHNNKDHTFRSNIISRMLKLLDLGYNYLDTEFEDALGLTSKADFAWVIITLDQYFALLRREHEDEAFVLTPAIIKSTLRREEYKNLPNEGFFLESQEYISSIKRLDAFKSRHDSFSVEDCLCSEPKCRMLVLSAYTGLLLAKDEMKLHRFIPKAKLDIVKASSRFEAAQKVKNYIDDLPDSES
jgi:hypothetical protein